MSRKYEKSKKVHNVGGLKLVTFFFSYYVYSTVILNVNQLAAFESNLYLCISFMKVMIFLI